MTRKGLNGGISTLVTHYKEGNNPYNAHVSPIYQTSTFGFENVDSGAAIMSGEEPGFFYTRINNPNHAQLSQKIAALEGFDLIRENNELDPKDIVNGTMFSSGMAAVTSALLASVKSGDTIIAQHAIYGASFHFLHDVAPRYGINIVWVHDLSMAGWEKAFSANPDAKVAYAETPANPALSLVDLKMVADIAHKFDAWLIVDNTFATPYCQRPLTSGADVVIHSTTKYLSGHGQVIGGVVVSPHIEYVHNELFESLDIYGGVASPFDTWLTNIGLKTFELRMQQHCKNAMEIATYLENHAAVNKVFYPGLASHPDHDLARRQMMNYGGMIAFELNGGLEAGIKLMNNIKLCTLAVSLGNVDTLIQHPASMTHSTVPRDDRLAMGISDGLVRFSVGIENVEDIISDLEQALT